MFFSIEKKGIAVIRIRYNLFMYQKFKQLKKDKPYFYHFIMVMLLMLWAYLIAVFFTLPYENGVLHLGADSGFHMNRMISLATAIENKDPYPYLNWFQNYNFGYPTPIFYSNLMMYLPTQWLMNGKDVVIVFKDYVTMLVMVSSFFIGLLTLKVSKYSYAPFLTMLIFQCNTHAITDVLRRGGLGELLALVFIPIILMGIYDVFYNQRPKGIWLCVGFLGLVLSHNISFILMVILFVIFGILNINKVFKDKRRIVIIIIAAVCAFSMALFFIAPMLEQMNALDLVVEHNGNANGVIEGTTLKELFNFTTDTSIYLNGSAGPFLIFLPLVGLTIKNKKKNNPFIYHCLILGYCFYFAMLNIFPWKLLPIFSFLQFSQRLLPIAIPLLAVSGGHYCASFAKRIRLPKVKAIYYLGLINLVILVTLPMLVVNYQQIAGYDDHTSIADITQPIFDELQANASYNVQQLSSADYLPYKAMVDYRDYREYVKWDVSLTQNELVTDESVLMDSRTINSETYGHFSFTIANNLHANNRIAVPRTYYVGYQVDVYIDDVYDHTIIPTPQADTGLVQFALVESETPIKYDIYYRPTKIQVNTMNISIWALRISCTIYTLSAIVQFIIYNQKKLKRGIYEGNRWIRKYWK